jgi:hypothetical protein
MRAFPIRPEANPGPYIMSWSIVIQNLEEYDAFPREIIETQLTHNLNYPLDMNRALKLAKELNLKSCTLAGGRTPDPYDKDNETVMITITGFSEAEDFVTTMRRITTTYTGQGGPADG